MTTNWIPWKHQKSVLWQLWVWEAQNQKCPRGHSPPPGVRTDCTHCLFQLWGLRELLDVSIHHPSSGVCPRQSTSSVAGPLSSSVCLLCVIGFRAYLENRGWSPSLNILNLFIAVKTHFPNKIWKLQQFQDMRTCLFRGHHSIHYQCQNKEVKIIDRNDVFVCDKNY